MLKPVLNAKETLGDFLVLVGQRPFYKYVEQDGEKVKSDLIQGYSYECVAVERKYEKVIVKVEGTEPLYKDNNSLPENSIVDFKNLTGSVYVTGNDNYKYVACSFKADQIIEVEDGK